MNDKIIKIITQSGLAGAFLILAYIFYKILTNDLNHIGNYINENTKVIKSIEKTVEMNTTQMGRLEEVIKKIK